MKHPVRVFSTINWSIETVKWQRSIKDLQFAWFLLPPRLASLCSPHLENQGKANDVPSLFGSFASSSLASLHSPSKLQVHNPAVGRSVQTTRNSKSLQQQAKMVDLVVRNHDLVQTRCEKQQWLPQTRPEKRRIIPRRRAQGRRAMLKLAAVGVPIWLSWMGKEKLAPPGEFAEQSKVLGATKRFTLLCKGRQAACSGMKHTP